jgi:hypothetical protein
MLAGIESGTEDGDYEAVARMSSLLRPVSSDIPRSSGLGEEGVNSLRRACVKSVGDCDWLCRWSRGEVAWYAFDGHCEVLSDSSRDGPWLLILFTNCRGHLYRKA